MKTLLRTVLRKTVLRQPLVWKRHMGLDDRDYFLASYPKSGNTWVKFMLATLYADRELGYEDVERIIPAVGFHREAPRIGDKGGRVVKTHEKYRPGYRRGIYIVRDPRDVAISFYYYLRREGQYSRSLGDWFQDFLCGRIGSSGAWDEHVEGWLKASRGSFGISLIRYEDIFTDPFAVMRMIVDELGLVVADERLRDAISKNTADKMREKEKEAPAWMVPRGQNIPFVRAARIEQWKEAMDGVVRERFADRFGRQMEELGYEL